MQNIDVALVEAVHASEKTVIGSTATVLDNKFILITSNLIVPFLDIDFNDFTRSLESGILVDAPKAAFFQNQQLPQIRIISKNGGNYLNAECKIVASFKCHTIAWTSRKTLSNWAIDNKNNNNNLLDVLSLFFILMIADGETPTFMEFRTQLENSLIKLWHDIKTIDLFKTQEIYLRSAPFGSRSLIDSYSKGIISNLIGNGSCLIISDCPTTPGSEGSPVFLENSNSFIGIVLSSLCWWKGDWTGLTLIVDIRAILKEILNAKNPVDPPTEFIGVVATMESTLLRVCCGSSWGTGIVINLEDGIVLTNSHVLDSESKIKVYHRGSSTVAKNLSKILSKTEGSLDLAVLKCDSNFLKSNNLKSSHSCRKPEIKLGDDVYCCGFAIFPQEISISPSISKGCLSQINNWMIKTTCSVNSGMSGGAVFTSNGEFLGIIVCNLRIPNGTVFPKFNVAIPYFTLSPIFEEFFINKDESLLADKLLDQRDFAAEWNMFKAKL